MSRAVLVDTGPLVAYLVRDSEHHEWACEQMRSLFSPLYTCEPVLAEAAHILRRNRLEPEQLMNLLETGIVMTDFNLQAEVTSLKMLLRRYRTVPMSLADACLVRMSELRSDPVIFTTDSDFRIYRRHARLLIPLLFPPAR